MNSLHVRKLVSSEWPAWETVCVQHARERERVSDNIRVFAFVQHTIRFCGCWTHLFTLFRVHILPHSSSLIRSLCRNINSQKEKQRRRRRGSSKATEKKNLTTRTGLNRISSIWVFISVAFFYFSGVFVYKCTYDDRRFLSAERGFFFLLVCCQKKKNIECALVCVRCKPFTFLCLVLYAVSRCYSPWLHLNVFRWAHQQYSIAFDCICASFGHKSGKKYSAILFFFSLLISFLFFFCLIIIEFLHYLTLTRSTHSLSVQFLFISNKIVYLL